MVVYLYDYGQNCHCSEISDVLRYFPIEHWFASVYERRPTMHEEYVKEIIELLKKCDDLSLLDLIFQLLKKHSEQI